MEGLNYQRKPKSWLELWYFFVEKYFDLLKKVFKLYLVAEIILTTHTCHNLWPIIIQKQLNISNLNIVALNFWVRPISHMESTWLRMLTCKYVLSESHPECLEHPTQWNVITLMIYMRTTRSWLRGVITHFLSSNCTF